MTATPRLGGEFAKAAATRVCDRFEIIRTLGRGGTAAVYEAHDPETNQRVALKLLHEDLTRSEAQRHAFLAEAHFMRRVRHPGIARIIDFGEQPRDGLPAQAWVAMEIVSGVSLSQLVREHGPLSVLDALLLGERLLDLLEVVHQAGIVHRDITPANVMVRVSPTGDLEQGSVRLLDFGLAADAGAPATLGPTSPLIWGSAAYLSPEHASGAPVFPEADLYQVGGVLCFALTGGAPFDRKSAEELMRAHLGEAPLPPSTHRIDIPASVDRLVLRALEKNPEARFPSAQEMRRVVRATRQSLTESEMVTAELVPVPAYAAEVGTEARSAIRGTRAGGRASRRGDRLFLIVGAALLVAVLTVAGLLAMIGEKEGPLVRATSTQPVPPVEAPVEPAPAAVVPRLVVVPDVAGRPLVEARLLLDAAGLVPGEITSVNGAVAADTVLGVAESVSIRMAVGSPIALNVASGWNAVPPLVGLSEADASLALGAAGFSGAVGWAGPSGADSPSPVGPPLVLSSHPAAGAVERLGVPVTVLLGYPAVVPTPVPVEPETPVTPGGPDSPEQPTDPTETVHLPVSRTLNNARHAFTRGS